MPPQGMMPPPGMPYQQPMMAPRTSGMAIAGFILSFFCALLGLIFSIIGYNECKKSMGTVKGEGLALAGIIIAILNILLAIMLMASSSGHHRY